MSAPDSGSRPQRFGGAWTIIKLAALEKYCRFYTTALKNQGFRLLYIDAFAGEGDVRVKVDGAIRIQPGSARLALANEPAFQEIIFIEKKLARCKRLEELVKQFPSRAASVKRGDANAELTQLCHQLSGKSTTRAVLFLDPFGMNVHWSTLRAIAATKIVDVWYLFPLSSLYRQMALDSSAIDEAKAAAIDSILGTTEWRTAFYSPLAQGTLFDQPADVRPAGWLAISQYVTARLRTIFPAVVDPRLLHQVRVDGQMGPPLFALYFACSNPHTRAQELACRAARHILHHS